MSPRSLVAAAVAAALVLASLTSCTPTPSSPTAPPDSAEQYARWGAPANPDGSIELQSDVVVVGGGRNAVWGASSDGTTWTLDSNAPGMKGLAVGKVLLATGYATGRIAQITAHGDRTDVVLAPIAITDLIKNGEVKFDQDVKPGALEVQGFDGGSVSDVAPGTNTSSLDTGTTAGTTAGFGSVAAANFNAVPPAADVDPLADKPLPFPAKQFSKETDDWTLSGGTAADGLHFAIETEAAGLKISGSAVLLFDALHVNLGTVITNSVAGGTKGQLSGIQGVKVDLAAGTNNQGGETFKKEFELPFEIPVQAVIGGVPVFMKFTTSMIVSAALVGTNATITGAGQWTLGNGLDVKVDGETINADGAQDLKVVHSIMDSISGIAIGGAVFNLGFKLRLLMGVGSPFFGAGGFVTLSVTVGIGIGSALGSPIVVCRSASYDMKFSTGVGLFSDSAIVSSLLEKIPHIKDLLPDKDLTKESVKSLLHKTQTLPENGVCVGGSDAG